MDSRGQIFISNLHDIKCEPNFELIQKNRTLVSVTEYTGATKIIKDQNSKQRTTGFLFFFGSLNP